MAGLSPARPADSPRSRLAAVLVPVGVVAVAYGRMATGEVLFFRDLFRHTYPVRLFMRARVESGHLPVWHPGLGLGSSGFANPLWGHFYPPNWLFLVGPLLRAGWPRPVRGSCLAVARPA